MNIIITKFGEALTGLVQDALFSGERQAAPFIDGNGTFGDILNMASGMLRYFTREKAAINTVCLCSEDKRVISAAIIASLSGGPDLVLPYSFSEQVLEETREYTGFTHIISEYTPPCNATMVHPDMFSGDPLELSLERDLDSEFLMLFTGGSTGKPKVWPKTVRNVFAEAMYLSKKYSFSREDKILATVPPYHIYGFLFSVLIPLVSGASVIERVCTFPREIINAIEQESPTVLVAVPVHYRVLKGAQFSGNALRTAFSSAGPLNPEDGESFSRTSGVPIVEVYGSTETGGIATRCRARGETSLRIFDNVDWKIMNERLCVHSEFISPTLTFDREGFFVTGDRAEKDGEGSFRLMGRADGVVKVAGKRIDIEEMQEKIRGIPHITDCIIVPIESRKGKETELGALIEGDVEESVLREKMKAMFEPYALPRRVRIVTAIPRLKTGKYDRKKIIEYFM
ncbi:MAG TPA: fatty acid--CoA ligase family protein [Spirochaetota bacterium]|nr:fatty acid--CoA ligase family protein [Spirochaetota bacterium]HPI88877.1 fatty acid--CoA ligase family protein [Spirochaetota bacterium]HPR46993.1 fatty acid--CoA ligase family protein [Spirochaetota bacterium]